ncbi:DsbC family protein [Acinetobacter nosocomialis]|uniref:DsbC family protein n=1 Tax=Acinetobacter nosocomialis TaxID=106654 RepID=UPI0029D636FB|nr:DsbC family protein [Acinetobacter nosocomialis]MDX7882086.1 DsbC family protein [Acinetobacter nosocomialis]
MNKLNLSIGILLAIATSLTHATKTDDVKAKVLQNYPATTVSQVNETPLKNIYEVVMGKNVAYTDEEARYFIFGNLFDMKTQTDLTTTPSNKIEIGFPSKERLKDAVKTVKGNGKRKLAVFSDPDCPYCQQLEHNLQSITDVTIYTFLFPLESLHPRAKGTAISIWCAKDQSKAYHEYMLNNKQPQVKSCENPIDRNIQFGGSMGIQGTPSVIFEDGSLIPGAISAPELERQLQEANKKVNGGIGK